MFDAQLQRLISETNLQVMAAICCAIAVAPLFVLWAYQAREEKARLLEVVGWSLIPSSILWGVIGYFFDRPPEVLGAPIIATLLVLAVHEFVVASTPAIDVDNLPDPLADALRERNGATS